MSFQIQRSRFWLIPALAYYLSANLATPHQAEPSMTEGPQDRSRRRLLQTSVLGGAAAMASVPLRSLAASVRERTVIDSAPDVPSFEFDEVSIAELQAGMTAGKYSARSIAEKYLARIDQIDKHGPAINSVIEINPDALSIAESLDTERKDKAARGPL